MLDFRTETFIIVCQYMNFTKAAEKLGITQPAVSQHIRYIENEYNIKLFNFTGKKLFLTDAGKILLDSIITMKHDQIHLKNQLKTFSSSHLKQLNFGATLTVGEFIIQEKLSRYLKNHKNVSVKMLINNTHVLLKKLNSGEIDFAIVEGYFKKNEYDHLLLSKEKYIAVCSPLYLEDIRKKNKASLTFEALFEKNLIIREKGSGTREILELTLEGMNYAIKNFATTIEISNMNTIKYLTTQGCGITFLYEVAVRNELANGQLIEIPIENFHISHDITFIWRKGSIFSKYYKELFSEFK